MSLPDIDDYIARVELMAGEVEGLAADTPVRPVDKVGIIGAGTMGLLRSGTHQEFARSQGDL